MYGSIIGGTDVTIVVCTQYHWWYRCHDSGMYGSIIGGTDVTIVVCTQYHWWYRCHYSGMYAVSLVVQMSR